LPQATQIKTAVDVERTAAKVVRCHHRKGVCRKCDKYDICEAKSKKKRKPESEEE
jgi:hypothetical protein